MKPGLSRRRAWRQWYLTGQYAERLGHEIAHFLIWSLLESGCLSNLGTSFCRLQWEARPQQEEGLEAVEPHDPTGCNTLDRRRLPEQETLSFFRSRYFMWLLSPMWSRASALFTASTPPRPLTVKWQMSTERNDWVIQDVILWRIELDTVILPKLTDYKTIIYDTSQNV